MPVPSATEAAFLADIAADPGDDLVRLIFADWLNERGDPRGDFLRVQCELARPGGPVRLETIGRELALLREHAHAWKDDPPGGIEVRFERGLLHVHAAARVFAAAQASPWWKRQRPWVMKLVLMPCDDESLHALAVQAALDGVPGLDLGPGVTDRGLSRLAALTELRTLNLAGATVTDAGLVHLSSLTGLRELYLLGGGVGDAGLAFLAPLTRLRTLYLNCPGISDAALADLAPFTRLQALQLAETSVTDRGLVHLAALTELRWLDLSFTRVTDRGLQQLAPLPSLRGLMVAGTRATGGALKRALPQLEIGH